MTSALGRAALITASAASVLLAQPPAKSVWVLGGSPSQPSITQFDSSNFVDIRTIAALPAHAIDHPEYFSVNAAGDLLFVTRQGVAFGDDSDAAGKIYWYADAHARPPFPREERPEWPRDWFLSSAASGLYALESRQTKTLNADGNDETIRTSTRLLHRTTSNAEMTSVVELPALPLCKCETGVCSETCPQWQVWAPGHVIGDFFLATRLIEGQLQSDYQETHLFRRTGGSWQSTRLASAIESPLDASSDGQILLAAEFDAGCCGWMNESSDQLLLFRNGKRTVLFDEMARFDNRNYDVSVSVGRAELSPANTRIAYTIAADALPAGEAIRLSSDGKPNAEELARVRKAIAASPTVEIVDLNQPASRPVSIAHAEAVGWISEAELLVVENGRLATYDARGTRRRQSAIEANSAARVFVR